MRPPFRRRVTFGAQLAAWLHFGFWLFVAFLSASCCSLPARNDAGVHRVRGVECPRGEKFLFIEQRFSGGSSRLFAWCRDTTRAGR